MMNTTISNKNITNKINNKNQEDTPIYSKSLLCKKITLLMKEIGGNIQEVIETILINKFEGFCIEEGLIKKNSIKLKTYSSGTVIRGDQIQFTVIFECLICMPVEGAIILCKVESITNAGIKSTSINEKPSPIVVYVARDFQNNELEDIVPDNIISVKVIGYRIELHDTIISIIGEFINIIQKNSS